MTSTAAVKQGFALARRAGPAVWTMFLTSLVLAAVAAWPIYHGMVGFTGHSLMSRTLRTGFSPDWLTDWSANYPGTLDRYGTIIAALGILSIFIDAVFA